LNTMQIHTICVAYAANSHSKDRGSCSCTKGHGSVKHILRRDQADNCTTVTVDIYF